MTAQTSEVALGLWYWNKFTKFICKVYIIYIWPGKTVTQLTVKGEEEQEGRRKRRKKKTHFRFQSTFKILPHKILWNDIIIIL